jgi:hypothetical protein
MATENFTGTAASVSSATGSLGLQSVVRRTLPRGFELAWSPLTKLCYITKSGLSWSATGGEADMHTVAEGLITLFSGQSSISE